LTVETNLPVGRLSSVLFEMEMRGLVRLFGGGSYRLI
jgi:DNA processing protein